MKIICERPGRAFEDFETGDVYEHEIGRTVTSTGNTTHACSEVLEKRESKSRPHMGIVWLRTTGFNQEGTVVIEFKRAILIYKRDHLPNVAMKYPDR